MAGRSRRAWFSVLLGLVVGFTLASRLILPRANELKRAGQKRKANPAACGINRGLKKDGVIWAPQVNDSPTTENPGTRSLNFLFVGVMTAQKYLKNRAVAAHRRDPVPVWMVPAGWNHHGLLVYPTPEEKDVSWTK
nr:chondroitin sulfate synthase 1-like isoform X1 [Nothobranchius furzeri]